MNQYVFIVITGIVCCHGIMLPSLHATSAADTKIVGGEEETSEKYSSYMVFVTVTDKDRLSYNCGGTIINAYNCLTAAHCLFGMEHARSRIGSSIANSGGREYISSSTELVCHPQYEPSGLTDDIGIIKVSKGMDFTGINAAAVQLPDNKMEMTPGSEVRVLGWGRTKEGGSVSKTLKYVIVHVMSQKECTDQHGSAIRDSQFCAGEKEGGKDSCQGDSGGPAFVDGVQRGVISFGSGCARPNKAGVYTNLAKYFCWIQTTIFLPLPFSLPLVCDLIKILDPKA